MKPQTIHQDQYSLLVRTDGRLYRPVPTPGSYPHPLAVGMGGPPYFKNPCTSFKIGDKVRARQVYGSPFARVTNDRHEEFWHSHGMYLGQPSTQNWDPAPDVVPEGELG